MDKFDQIYYAPARMLGTAIGTSDNTSFIIVGAGALAAGYFLLSPPYSYVGYLVGALHLGKAVF
jgi:hypothetical protein